MRKIFITFLTFLAGISPSIASNSIDEKIDSIFAPFSNLIAKAVFYPIQIGTEELPIVILWLIIGSIIFTLYTKFIGVWGFKHAIDIVLGKNKKDEDTTGEEGEVSSFQALATALSGTVGLGNIAGVAIAISLGGPGAMFWMILGAIFGMASKFFECTLGVKYRSFNKDGSVSGGPMHYISKGLAKKGMKNFGKFLAGLFAFMCIGGAVSGGNMIQINQATEQLIYITGGESSFFFDHSWVFGLFIATVIGLIIIGGIKSIARVTEKIVPFMCLIYMIAAIVVILFHITEIPHALYLILKGAFSPQAVEGGIIGVIIIGLRRSVQSNEAGTGSAPIAYAAVKTKEPVSQGFVSLLEPFIDTIVLCSLTAFTIILTGKFTDTSGITGVELTSQAFETVIPFFPYILAIAIILFALSTLISWSYYGQKAWNYIVGEGTKRTRIYQLIFCTFIVIGSSMNLRSILDFTDAMMLGMAFPNMLAMFILMPEIRADLKNYCKRFDVKYPSVVLKDLFVKDEEEVAAQE